MTFSDSVNLATDDHDAIAESLVAEMHANDGLVEVDIEQFWQDNKAALVDPFGRHLKQPGLRIFNFDEAIFKELGVDEDFWRYDQDADYRHELRQALNKKSQHIIGRRLYPDVQSSLNDQYPKLGALPEVFGAEQVWASGSWWLEECAHSPTELEALLDEVDRKDVREVILPESWQEAKARLMSQGKRSPLYAWQRGPVTFATSIYGAEDLLMLLIDQPELAEHLRDTILRVMLEIGDVLEAEAGYAPGEKPRGFGFADDNCALLNPELYAFFGQPILQTVYDRFAPQPGDRRYQHSDSAMAHLLPLLAETGMNQVNFGPTVSVREIREHMPDAVIEGRLAPFTLGRCEWKNIVKEVLRDIDEARSTRGLLVATAGSIVSGSRLQGIRLIMATIQRYGQY